MISVRSVIAWLAVAFAVYLAARGLWWVDPVPYPWLLVAALVLFVCTTFVCVFWDGPSRERGPGDRRRTTVLPSWAAALAVANAVLAPVATSLAVSPWSLRTGFATWYLGGIGALMTILMVRGRPWAAWSGLVILIGAASAWIGLPDALALGLVGSAMWVALAQLLQLSVDRAARDTSRLVELQRAASAWQTTQAVRQRERRVRIQRAVRIASPVLTRVIETGGVLSPEERSEARVAEGTLRDELRGTRLLDEAVRVELARTRRRGASVTVLDDGGLDDADPVSLDVIRGEIVETLRDARSERLYIRTSSDRDVAVTVVGRSGSGPADEDDVDLWREIPRPAPS